MTHAHSAQGAIAAARALLRWMGPENPTAVLTVMVVMTINVVAHAVHSMPSPEEPTFPGLLWLFGVVAGGVWHLVTVRSRDGLQDRCFLFGLVGASAGTAVYLGFLAAYLL